MDKSTMGLIYALKRHAGEMPIKEVMVDYMSALTLSPKDVYTPGIIERCAQNFFVDYLRTCDNPSYEVWRLFYNMGKPWHGDLAESILVTLELVQVRNDGKYVNGFSDEGES